MTQAQGPTREELERAAKVVGELSSERLPACGSGTGRGVEESSTAV